MFLNLLNQLGVPVVLVFIAVAMIIVERVVPARTLPRVKWWWPRVLFLNALQAAIIWVAAVGWEWWLKEHRPWSIEWMGPSLGALFAYFVMTYFYYWWHRWRHEVPLLWNWVHQVHHSVNRIEVAASFYKHPLEIFLNGIIVSTILYTLVGCTPQQATYVILISGVAEFYYHWNVPTPVWTGYILQRPESHRVHHAKKGTNLNLSDLPLWDMIGGGLALFGGKITFFNPGKNFECDCGFADDLESKEFFGMLVGKDVSHCYPQKRRQTNDQ